MLDSIVEQSPAKINLFLKVISKRVDGFHNIRSGVTLVNLCDEVIAIKNSNFKITYKGNFAPSNNVFKNCIIERLFEKIEIKKPKIHFIINKNIPVQSGLGSASSNVAAVLRILERLDLYKSMNYNEYISIGSDVPLFVNQSDCLIREKGNKIINQIFPKYFFLIVKPNINCSTSEMYQQLNSKYFNYMVEYDLDNINEYDVGNDFEEIAIRNNKEIMNILTFLRDLSGAVFSRMTGSGSCCFAVFENLESAIKAQKRFKSSFPKLWNFVAQNNNTILNKL